jgi:diguanylate cyclase (GGDEF)-like protein
VDSRESRDALPIRVLLVDDNPLDAELQIYELRRAALAIEPKVVSTEAGFRDALETFAPQVILCDFSFPDFDGAAALAIVKNDYPEIPLILVSGTLTEDRLALVVENGAADYVLKSKPIRLPGAVLRAIERAEKARLLAEAQQRVERLSAIRDCMSEINGALLRNRDRPTLFAEACRIATSVGKFPFAAIITRRDAQAPLRIVASAGIAVEAIVQDWLDTIPANLESGAGTIGTAYLERIPAVVNDMHPSLSLPWRAQLWERGLRSGGSFPLVVGNATAGVMMICSDVPNFFNEEEVTLLSDIAGNLSFALAFIAEQQRVGRLSRIRDVLSAVPEAIVRVADSEQLLAEVCRIAYATAGYVNVLALALEDGERLRIVTAAGECAVDIPAHQLRVDERVRSGKGLALPALRDREPKLANDRTGPGRVRASAAFPLVVGDRSWGALMFDTAVSGHFDEEEVHLLTNLANNLSLALDHRERQKRLTRLSRIRDVLSAVNAAIVRLSDGAELCREACRIAVESGGFVNASFLEVDVEARAIEIAAFLGRSDRTLLQTALRRTFADPRRDPGIVETSIRTERPAVRNSLGADDSEREWVGRDGIRSAGSFPIVFDGRCTSALLFESDVPDYFDAEEVDLLSNLTGNVAFGLNFLEKQRRVDYLSYYDAMTELPNRTLFYDRLGRDIAACANAGKLLSLAVIDIVRFSDLNNWLGEHVGDEALRSIAQRLRESAGQGHVARIGGDKFALYVPMLDDLHSLTDILDEEGMRAFGTPFTVGTRQVAIAARAGCAIFPVDGQSPEELFQNAEAALLSAKASGSGYCFYAPELNVRLAKKLELETRLRRALECNQFVLYYQPKVSVSDRALAGFEALLRWNDPDRGIVPPGEFIPLMEQNGMIVNVGRWALGEAARQYEAWRCAGLRPPRIAVNLSVVQLRHARLVDDIRAAVSQFDQGCGLDLEVTESMLLENSAATIQKLDAIRALGPELSLDDFGTGYSSLAYLQRLPLNAVKVDRSFISGMIGDVNKTTIVSTIVSLGRALNLTVIAEGVESESELAILETLQCDQFQGYLFSRPVPAEEATRFMTRVPTAMS